MSVLARRITSEAELAEAFEFAMSNPAMRTVLKSAGFSLTLEQFLTQKDRFTFITFDQPITLYLSRSKRIYGSCG